MQNSAWYMIEHRIAAWTNNTYLYWSGWFYRLLKCLTSKISKIYLQYKDFCPTAKTSINCTCPMDRNGTLSRQKHRWTWIVIWMWSDVNTVSWFALIGFTIVFSSRFISFFVSEQKSPEQSPDGREGNHATFQGFVMRRKSLQYVVHVVHKYLGMPTACFVSWVSQVFWGPV